MFPIYHYAITDLPPFACEIFKNIVVKLTAALHYDTSVKAYSEVFLTEISLSAVQTIHIQCKWCFSRKQ